MPSPAEIEQFFVIARQNTSSHPEIFKLIDKYGINIINAKNMKSSEHTGLLWLATLEWSDEELEKLLSLKTGIDINLKDKVGQTALNQATTQKKLTKAQLLIRFGADVNNVNKIGSTPLIFAARQRRPDLVTMLLEAGANPDIGMLNSPLQFRGKTFYNFVEQYPEIKQAYEPYSSLYKQKTKEEVEKYLIPTLTTIVGQYLFESPKITTPTEAIKITSSVTSEAQSTATQTPSAISQQLQVAGLDDEVMSDN